jgi:hypothetical protein
VDGPSNDVFPGPFGDKPGEAPAAYVTRPTVARGWGDAVRGRNIDMGASDDPSDRRERRAADLDSSLPAVAMSGAAELAEAARESLRREGLPDDAIDRLAQRYVAMEMGTTVADFIEWARTSHSQSQT